MKKTILLTILFAATTCYGLYSSYRMVYLNRAPFVIECVGVGLDPSKKYAISNALQKTPDTLVIDFAQGKGILPDTLGYVVHNPANNSFELRTGGELMLPLGRASDNPFLAFARTSEDSFFRSPQYFGSDSTIPAEILKSGGVKFNSIAGDRSSRVSIRLTEFEGRTYLKTRSEGIGTTYPLQAGSPNRISVTCNQPVKSDYARAYFFENTTSSKCDSVIEVLPSSTFDYTYKILNARGETVGSGGSGNDQFEVDGYLFRVSPRYTVLDAAALILSLLALAGFQIFFTVAHARSATPPIKSIIAIRLLLNCVAFLSVPLYLTAVTVTPNRWVYLAALLFLNASYFTSKRFLHNFNFDLNRWWRGAVWVAVILSPVFMRAFSSNESLFGIPILHVQKLLVLGLIFITQGSSMGRISYSSWMRIGLILSYAFVLSLVTSDLGSFLYTFIAFVLVEAVRKSVSPKAVVAFLLFLAVGIFLSYSISGGAFADRKLYRMVAPYTSPASDRLARAHESDRETYSSLHLIQKNLTRGLVPDMDEVLIPAPMRSTSFSDFAFFWSLVFGKAIFAVLFFAVQFLLLYELAFLLFISVRAIRINETEAFVLPVNRESEFVRFLLAFAVVTFTYPVLSNLLLVPLTGQSYPCLSISIIEVVILTIFLAQISSIFTNPKYVRATGAVAYGYRDVLNSLKFAAFILASLALVAFAVKLFDIKLRPDEYRWQKLNKEFAGYETENVNPADKSTLIKKALSAVGGDELTSVHRKKKPYLKNLASFYFSGKPYNQIHVEGSYFENTADAVARRMSAESAFSVERRLVSGPHRPFGDVFSYAQTVNGKPRLAYSNEYYQSIPESAASINADLTAELSRELSRHMEKTGSPSNVGSILIVDNSSGGIAANSTYPLGAAINSNETHYNIGSLKKMILAYCALAVDPEYKHKIYNNRSFRDFIKWSDDVYAAALLKDLMLKHEQEFADILRDDFSLPLISQTEDAYFDGKPDAASYSKPLDRTNELYRYSIGQQKPYQFIKVVEWYSRIASGKKVTLSYGGRQKYFDSLSLPEAEMSYLRDAAGGVLVGTAANVGAGLSQHSIQPHGFIAKTGTAESASKQFNSSSSFVIAYDRYTVGIMLSGRIPFNSQNLAAKNLMVSIIPILKKYRVLASAP